MNRLSKIFMSLILLCFSTVSFATDTRSYNMLPIGTNVIDSQYTYLETTQKTISGLEGQQNQNQVYIRDTYYFNVNGTLGAAYIMLPYSKQTLDITKPVNISKSGEGFGDLKVLFALGLYNMPALNPDEFQKFDKNGLHAACSLAVTLPTGAYDKLSSTNVGANRYSYKPECAAYWVNNQFQADFFVGNTFYTDNTSYAGSKTLSQSNLYNIEARFSYNFTPSFWASTDFVYYKGGETSINGIRQKDDQNNLNAGFTLAYRVARSQVIKLIYQKTVSGKEHSPQMQNGVGLSYSVAF